MRPPDFGAPSHGVNKTNTFQIQHLGCGVPRFRVAVV